MLELLIEKVIFKLDFIDLNILESLINNDNSLAFPILVKRLKKVNVWDRGIIRRRIKKLKDLKIIHYEEHTSPLIIECYLNKEKQLEVLKEMLKRRLIRY